MGKLLEKCFTERIERKFTEEKFIVSNQFGFRKHEGTEHLMMDAVHGWSDELIAQRKKKNPIRGLWLISFDFAKAFDSVWTPALLVALFRAGIDGRLWCLIYSYLTTRTQKVNVNGVHSDLKHVKNRGLKICHLCLSD